MQGERLARLTPVVQPFPCRPGTSAMTSYLTRRLLARAIARLGGRVSAVMSAWPQFPVSRQLEEQVRVYWAQDDFVGGAALLGLNARLLDKRERKVAASADLVVAANPVVAETWRGRGLNPVLVPFGTDVDAGDARIEDAAWPPDVDLPAPVVGFVGHLNNRTDIRLLGGHRPPGPVAAPGRAKDPAFEPARFDALKRLPNVRWVGSKPAWTARPSESHRRRDRALRRQQLQPRQFPAEDTRVPGRSCRAVVATDLPAIRWLATDLVCIAAPASFADKADQLLAKPRTTAMVASRQAFAAQHSWARRAADIHRAITSLQQ